MIDLDDIFDPLQIQEFESESVKNIEFLIFLKNLR